MTTKEEWLRDFIAGPLPLPAYLLANLPNAADFYHQERMFLIGVPDATGGATVCFSDGTNWIDLQTGSAVA